MVLPQVLFLGVDLVSFSLDLAAFVGLYLIVSLSTNLEYGYAGIPNFGKVLFVLAGAAVGGAFTSHFAVWLLNVPVKGDFVANDFLIIPQVNTILQGNIPLSVGLLILALFVAGVAGGLFGFIFSFPAIRLKEDYLAMLLFGMAAIFQLFVIDYTPLAGGTFGLQVPDVFAWAGDYRFVAATGAILLFGFLTYACFELIARSPAGRALRAMRDSSVAAEACGKDTIAMRRNVLIVASAFSAVAGALYVFYTTDVLGGSFNMTPWTFWPLVIVIIGGIANNAGVLLGTGVFLFALKALDAVKYQFTNILPFDVTWLEYFLIAAVLVSIIMLRPQGLLTEKPSATIPRKQFEEIRARFEPKKEEKSAEG